MYDVICFEMNIAIACMSEVQSVKSEIILQQFGVKEPLLSPPLYTDPYKKMVMRLTVILPSFYFLGGKS